MNDCAGEHQQHLQTTDPSHTNESQLCNSNKIQLLAPGWTTHQDRMVDCPCVVTSGRVAEFVDEAGDRSGRTVVVSRCQEAVTAEVQDSLCTTFVVICRLGDAVRNGYYLVTRRHVVAVFNRFGCGSQPRL
jgi:hypothetical protein